MTIPFLDLRRQHHALKTELLRAVERVLESSQFVLGWRRWPASAMASAWARAPTPCGWP